MADVHAENTLMLLKTRVSTNGRRAGSIVFFIAVIVFFVNRISAAKIRINVDSFKLDGPFFGFLFGLLWKRLYLCTELVTDFTA